MTTETDRGSRRLPESGPARAGRSGVLALILLAAAALGALLAVGYWPRGMRARQPAASGPAGPPIVSVAPVVKADAEVEVTLPGNIQAETEAPIFARADGYIKRRTADIGDRVEQGQVLAEIDSPELNQQIREAQAACRRSQAALRQAEAQLAQARANLNLAEVTAKRWRVLVDKGVLSTQDGDEKQAALEARKADAEAAEANVQAARDAVAAGEAALQRLLELQSFRRVVAPFPGIVIARNVDTGTLVSAGSSSSLRELFRIARIELLRVFVYVPQSEASAVRPGSACTVEVREYRNRKFPGKVTRTANALDPVSRTLLTEVQVRNPGGELMPGMYATVRLRLRRQDPPLLIPSAAFRNTEKGPMAAVVGDDAVVRFVPVTLGRDYGARIEVLGGLREGQKVIIDATDEVREGVKVRPVAQAKPTAAKAGGATK